MHFILSSDLHVGRDGKTHSRFLKFLKRIVEPTIKRENTQALLLAGDLVSHRQEQLEYFYNMIRQFVDIPVVACYGNHDWWVQHDAYKQRITNYEDILNFRQELHQKFDIWYVEDGPFFIGDVAIAGFDGWYGHNRPHFYDWGRDDDGNLVQKRFGTNDRDNMPIFGPTGVLFDYLVQKAHKDFEKLLYQDIQAKKKICITHFPPYCDNIKFKTFCANQNMLEPITQKFDVLCCGHSHRRVDFVENNCRVLNSGSDYNQPRMIEFSL